MEFRAFEEIETHHCDSIIEQWLSKHQDKEHLIHMHIFKHCNHGHRIHRGD